VNKKPLWNHERQRVSKSHPNSGVINAALVEILADLQRCVVELERQGKTVTASRIKALFVASRTDNSDDFISYGWNRAEREFRRRGKQASYDRYRAILNKLAAYQSPLRFEDITVTFLRQYEEHLRDHYGNSQDTIAKNLKALRAIYHQALGEDLVVRNPWLAFRIRENPQPRTKLTIEEIDRIANLELDERTPIWHARNVFLFQFYCHGMRISDARAMTWAHITNTFDGEGRPVKILIYQMGKTGFEAQVALPAQAQAIIDHYAEYEDTRVFAFMKHYKDDKSATAAINHQLKKVAELAGIDKRLTTHVARHSFSAEVLRRGHGIYVLSKSLFHRKVSTTESYAKNAHPEVQFDLTRDLFG